VVETSLWPRSAGLVVVFPKNARLGKPLTPAGPTCVGGIARRKDEGKSAVTRLPVSGIQRHQSFVGDIKDIHASF
jgi:hypothetical protein